MRLCSGVFMIRAVKGDTDFRMSSQSNGVENAESYRVREGDMVAVYPPMFHYDPELFESPLEFRYDRFLPGKRFLKDGKPVGNPLMTFGALCPGQQLATLQCHWTLLSLLATREYELLEGERTELDRSCYGHEVLPPTRDVRLRHRARAAFPHTLEISLSSS